MIEEQSVRSDGGRLGRLGYRAMWLLCVASWHLQRTAVVRASSLVTHSFEVENGTGVVPRCGTEVVVQHLKNGDSVTEAKRSVVDAGAVRGSPWGCHQR